ncbi:10 kDa heat shock protein, mitochondrial-like isoform X1 [Littorina saxatilis]|uniref:10 kDa heat shock protein, mitochondrial-like isoform X1 n=1 Tax=Littorina saxatilis TaxID=31220 RepID=UPI0038B42367
MKENINLQARAFKKFVPLFDRILVERSMPELKTKGGIMIPEKAQGKVQEAVVVATGSGFKDEKGDVTPVSVQVGEKVLLPEYGGTKIVLEEKEYFLFRDGDLLGKYELQ